MSLTEIAIKRPSLIVVLFAILTLMGVLSYNALSYELLPKFNVPIVTVATVYPGASPSEIENTVSKPVEEALSSLENVKRMNTISAENMSVIVVELESGADVDVSLREAVRKVNQVVPLLPQNAKAPVVNKIGSDEFPVMQLAVSSSQDPTTFFQNIKDDIKPQLASIKGVADIGVVGGEERAVRVNVNQALLESRHVSILQVVQAIGNANLDFPTGKIKSEDEQIRLRLSGKFSSLEELKNLVVATFPQGGGQVKLGEIAEVFEDKKDVTTINRINGKTSVGLMIKKQSDANGVEVASKLKEKIALLEKQYESQGTKFEIAQDASIFTLNAADAVKHDMMLAIFLVALVILVFLHSLKDSFIVMLAIPASFVTTFIFFYALGFSLNLMTLLALTLVVGILVDDSIVVLENIHRHLHMGKDKRQAALDGRNEIGFTALSITLVDVVVFLPLALSNAGIISDILRQFSWVIVISTMVSLFVSFTVTPLLASRISEMQTFTRSTLWGRINLGIEDLIDKFTNWYAVNLRWALNHKAITLIVIGVLFVASMSLAGLGFIGSEFVSEGDRGECIVYVELDKTSTMENTNKYSLKAEELLMKMPEVTNVFSSVGGSSSMEAGSAVPYKSEISIKLVPFKERTLSTNDFVEKAKKELTNALPGAKISGSAISIMGTADQAPIQMIISGETSESVLQYANSLKDSLKSIPGATDVELSVEAGVPEVKIEMDKEKLATLGLTVAMVGGTLQTAFAGNDQSKYRKGSTEYDIVVMLDGFDRKNTEDVQNISFMNNMGQNIRLTQFATVTPASGSTNLQRSNRRPSITLKSQLKGRDAGSVVAEFDKKIKNAKLPSTVSTVYIGQVADQAASGKTIGIAFLISIILVYLIMVALYDNYVYPFVVLFAIPVALIGAMITLALVKGNMSLFTMLGMLVMNGLVCKNSILIVDFTNKLKEDGMSTFNALIESVKERLRPILMTTLAMVLGMLPVALAKGAGAEWKNGLSWVLIGGLTSSMLLTVIVVPCVYMIVDNIKDKFSPRKPNEVAVAKTELEKPQPIHH